MLYLDLKGIMDDRGIENASQFLVKAGFTYYTANRLLTQTRSEISFGHLEKLCIALNCSLDDILVWVPPKGMRDANKHPLSKLMAKERKGSITAGLKDLPPEKLSELRGYIEKLRQPE